MTRLAIVGTPRQVIATIETLAQTGITQINLGGPLGPDPDHAIELVGQAVIPHFPISANSRTSPANSSTRSPNRRDAEDGIKICGRHPGLEPDQVRGSRVGTTRCSALFFHTGSSTCASPSAPFNSSFSAASCCSRALGPGLPSSADRAFPRVKEQPLPVRDRLLAHPATTSSLRTRHLAPR